MFIVPFFAVKIDKGIQRIYNIGFDLKKQNRGWSSYHSVRLKLGHTRGQSSKSKYATEKKLWFSRFKSFLWYFLGTMSHCKEVRFITAIVINPPERKLAKRTSVHWCHSESGYLCVLWLCLGLCVLWICLLLLFNLLRKLLDSWQFDVKIGNLYSHTCKHHFYADMNMAYSGILKKK